MDPTLQARIDHFKNALPPETSADIQDLVNDVFAAGKTEAGAAIDEGAAKTPVLGPLAATIVKKALDSALSAAQAEIDAFAAYHLTNAAS